MLMIAERFRGPPASANGGYVAGLIAALAPTTVAVRLRRPPPLGVAMHADRDASGYIVVRHHEDVIAEARPVTLALQVPPACEYVEALAASRQFPGFRQHAFPTCFVCGPARQRGDGLRIFPGELHAGKGDAAGVGRVVAAPWVPDASLAQADGKVAAEFMWAALDCPGGFAIAADGRVALLAEFTAHVDRRVRIDEPCVVIGWHIRSDGRMHEAGTALFDEDGELCGRAHALWIEPRAQAAIPGDPRP